MDIADKLRSYDGKRVAPFRAVAQAAWEVPEDALDPLLDLAATTEMKLQVGATWVLKHLAERGTAPRGRQAAKLLDLLGHAVAPHATLHVLQTLPHLEIPEGGQAALRRRLLRHTTSKRVFLRAWAYNGLGILAARDPEMRDEIEALFDRVAERESPAVRVRIRHARAAIVSGSAHGPG